MLRSFLDWRRSSFVGLVVLPLILVAVIIAALERQLTEYRLRETVKQESLHDIKRMLLDLATVVESCDSQAAAEHQVVYMAKRRDVGALLLADVKSHTVFASSNPEDLGRDLSLASDGAAARALRDFARKREISLNYSDGAAEGVFPIRLPWKKAESRGLAAEGAIYLRTDDVRRLVAESDHLSYWLDAVAAGRLLLVWGLGLWLVRRHITRPAREIKVGLRAIAAGRTATRIPPLGGAELGQVAKVLNETLDHVQQADQQVRAISNVAPVGIFWINPRGECLAVNSLWSQLTGLSDAESPGMRWLQAIHPEDRDRFSLAWSTPEISGLHTPETFRVQHRDGTLRWVLRSLLPLQDDQGKLTGYVGSLTDITALRALEDELRESEEKHRTLFETMTQGVFVFDAAGRITDANPAAQELCGLGLAELQAGDLPKSPHWRPFDENRRPIPVGNWPVKESRTTGKDVRNRTLGIVDHRSGLTRWFQVSVIGVRRTEFAPAGTTFATFHEITAVREAELALRKSETLYANLVETSHDLIFQCDAHGHFIFLNSAWQRTLGYPTTEMLGRPPTDFCDASSTPADLTVFTAALSGRRATSGELVLRSKSGQRVELLVEITPLGQGEEKIQGARGTAYDVTEQRKSERALKSTAQLFSSFFVNATEAMVLGGMDDKTIIEANGAAYRLFGYKNGELIGRDRHLLLDETDPRTGPAMKTREANGTFIGELSCLRKNGEKFEAEVTSIIYTGSDGRLLSGTIFRDLSAQKELLAVQARSQRLESIGTLTGGIAHDFNNALGPLLLGFDLLKKQFPERTGLVDNMRASTARAAATVRQLMTFARGSDGAHVPVASGAMFGEIARIVTSTFPREIRCITSVPPDTWPLLGDETQLQQVLLNLCLNARDAMPDGGELRLEAKNIVLVTAVETGRGRGEPGNYVRWKISDSGSGMTASVLERIFDPFFTTKGPGAGTGLGLAMVLGIVRGHYGFIDVQSTPDVGTTFLLYFPAGAPAGPEPSVASTPALGTRLAHRATLLLVDDEPLVREVTASVLTSLGFRVVTATDGTDALFKLTEIEGEVKAMLTDLQMPHMNGQALVRVVVKMMPDLPIIAMSGKFTAQDEADLSGLGVRGRLQKPFDESQLVTVLREIFPDGFQPPDPTAHPSQNQTPSDYGQNTDTR